MPRILIGPGTLMGLEGEFKSILESAGFTLVFPDRPAQMSEAELFDKLAGCDASLAGSEPYTRQVLAARPELKFIARSGVGYDAVDLAAATELGIPIAISPGNAEGVAEHTVGLILALAKSILPQHATIVAGGWPRRSMLPLRGKTLAIIGLGRIGKAVAIRARAFGMTLIAYDPVRDEAFAKAQGVRFTSKEECYSTGDYVTLHYPLTAGTRQSINRDVLGRMKPTAFLVNTARGGLVHEADLAEFLRSQRIAGAGLDVLDSEPPTSDNPLLTAPNTVMTAHTAGVDTASRDNMARIAAETVVRYFAGQWPGEVVVNPEVRGRVRPL
ncbi:MAG: phosphoglycerate dehydrogenase [Gemmataceae bacterium]|nr:phosphoglycerate dehydrogenase [Gemmataceae bacterium]